MNNQKILVITESNFKKARLQLEKYVKFESINGVFDQWVFGLGKFKSALIYLSSLLLFSLLILFFMVLTSSFDVESSKLTYELFKFYFGGSQTIDYQYAYLLLLSILVMSVILLLSVFSIFGISSVKDLLGIIFNHDLRQANQIKKLAMQLGEGYQLYFFDPKIVGSLERLKLRKSMLVRGSFFSETEIKDGGIGRKEITVVDEPITRGLSLIFSTTPLRIVQTEEFIRKHTEYKKRLICTVYNSTSIKEFFEMFAQGQFSIEQVEKITDVYEKLINSFIIEQSEKNSVVNHRIFEIFSGKDNSGLLNYFCNEGRRVTPLDLDIVDVIKEQDCNAIIRNDVLTVAYLLYLTEKRTDKSTQIRDCNIKIFLNAISILSKSEQHVWLQYIQECKDNPFEQFYFAGRKDISQNDFFVKKIIKREYIGKVVDVLKGLLVIDKANQAHAILNSTLSSYIDLPVIEAVEAQIIERIFRDSPMESKPIQELEECFEKTYKSSLNPDNQYRDYSFEIAGWIGTRLANYYINNDGQEDQVKAKNFLDRTKALLDNAIDYFKSQKIHDINPNSYWHFLNNSANLYEKYAEFGSKFNSTPTELEKSVQELIIFYLHNAYENYQKSLQVFGADQKWVSGSYANIALLIKLYCTKFRRVDTNDSNQQKDWSLEKAHEFALKSISIKKKINDLDELKIVEEMVLSPIEVLLKNVK